MTTTAKPPAATATEEHTVRVLPGHDACWTVYQDKVARLPQHAARDDGAGLALVPEAEQALHEQGFFTVTPGTTYAVTVLTATTCNLGCAYCFQNTALPAEGSFAPPRMAKAILTPDRVQQVAAFVADQMRRNGLTDTSLLLFGGEPLLNPEGALGMLRALKPLGLSKAEIITNGVLLTRQRAFDLADAGLQRVQITFDGARASHDTIRVTRNGRGTYDAILRNVTAAAQATSLNWHFRVNISHRNLAGLDHLIDDLATAVPAERTSLHLALIDDVGLGYDNAVSYNNELRDTMIALHQRAIDHGMFIPLSKPLTACPYCAAFGGTRGAVVNADGKLYSCWETAGRDDSWIVGDVTNGFLSKHAIRDRWVACDYDIKSHGTNEETRQFFDAVDSAALDAMYERRHILDA
jgi:uncharacterized protein